MPLIHVETSDIMCDLSDSDLLDEVRKRGLTIAVDPAHKRPEPQESAREAVEHLLGCRTGAALNAMRRLLTCYVPREILDAYEDVHAGNRSTAICLLDRFIEPSEAATATKLPKSQKGATTYDQAPTDPHHGGKVWP